MKRRLRWISMFLCIMIWMISCNEVSTFAYTENLHTALMPEKTQTDAADTEPGLESVPSAAQMPLDDAQNREEAITEDMIIEEPAENEYDQAADGTAFFEGFGDEEIQEEPFNEYGVNKEENTTENRTDNYTENISENSTINNTENSTENNDGAFEQPTEKDSQEQSNALEEDLFPGETSEEFSSSDQATDGEVITDSEGNLDFDVTEENPESVMEDEYIEDEYAEEGETYQGTCGDNLIWQLTENEKGFTLTISGEGKMDDYPVNSPPWTYDGFNITEVVMQEGITEIGDYAFNRCEESLESVAMPEHSLLSIGKSAFMQCYNLSQITIPSSVEYIGDYAFRGCTELTEIHIPGSVKDLGEMIFSDCTRLSSAEIQEGITVLSEGMFYGCENLSELILPTGITEIKNTCFEECSNLVINAFPESLKVIGESSFEGCTGIVDLALPDGLTDLGYRCFYGSGLQKIMIPASVTVAGGDVLQNCRDMKTIDFGGDKAQFDQISGGLSWDYIYFGEDRNVTVNLLGQKVTEIKLNYVGRTLKTGETLTLTASCYPEYACYGALTWESDNTGVAIIEDGGMVTAVGEGTAKISVTIEGTDVSADCLIKVINADHIIKSGNCSRESYWDYETDSNISSDVQWFLTGTDSNLTLIISGYGDMQDFEENTIPWASHRSKIKTLIVENGVSSIGSYAFHSLNKLEEVSLADSVREIGYSSFSDCVKLKKITLPLNLISIESEAFYNCSNLNSVEIHKSVTSIGWDAFSDANVQTIHIDDLTSWLNLDTESSGLRGDILLNGSPLKNIRIPEDVTSIRDYAFDGCSTLESVRIHGEVTRIGDNAFRDCRNLKDIMIPDSVAVIGYRAFQQCSSLKSIEIPDSIGRILYSTFSGCSSLTEIIIPGSVTEIESYAFQDCSSLKKIYIPDSVREIGYDTFENCTRLVEVNIPDSITVIDSGLFRGCSGLRNVIIPSSVTRIQDSAFKDCRALTRVTIPEGVTYLGYELFSGCENLIRVDVPKSVTEIDGLSIIPYNKNLIIYGIAGSTIEEYAENNELRFVDPSKIEYASVTGLAAKPYNGKAIMQEPVVKLGDCKLVKGTDYTLTFKNNTNAGTAKVTITGKGKYTGTKTATFKINKASQSISVKAASTIAVGKTTTVSLAGTKGAKSFKSLNTTIAVVDPKTGKVTAKKVGIVKITATSAATANYNAASKTVTIKVVPVATASLKAENQAAGIKLIWNKVTGANGYRIYRGSTLIKTITSGSTVTFADTKANTNGTKYTYKVVAKAAAGDSTLSKSVAVYKVARPAISSVTNSAASKMTVKWGRNAKANGYQIQYSTSKTFASGNKVVTVVGASTVSKVIGSLTKGKTYYVRIRTYKTVGSSKYWSAWSALKSVKVAK